MSNVAYSSEYRKRYNNYQSLFKAGNFTGNKEVHLSDAYFIQLSEYRAKIGDYSCHGHTCELFTTPIESVAKWHSIHNYGGFHKIIKHSNGKEYLIFNQDLYGYSVLDIESRKIMQFFPEKSLQGGETFIWTDIEYSPISNVLAVIGCYWACPYGVQLFTFDSPMSEKQKHIDLINFFEGSHEIYDDIDFVKWEHGDLHIMKFNTETEEAESEVITQNRYMTWLSERGKELWP